MHLALCFDERSQIVLGAPRLLEQTGDRVGAIHATVQAEQVEPDGLQPGDGSSEILARGVPLMSELRDRVAGAAVRRGTHISLGFRR